MKTKIAIAGIGGVGGFFGGLLAKQFSDSSDVEVHFLSRGKNLQAFKNKGLKVIQGGSEFVVKPNSATDNAAEIGLANFILVCTKAYDLESILEQLQPCINQDTVILPLLNGVDSKERIKKILPNNTVLDGCVYIVSRLKEPGVVENSGNIQTLYFGLQHTSNKQLLLLDGIFKKSGIEGHLSQNISTIIWEKFIFISPTATATSFFDQSIGAILADEDKHKTVRLLIEEVQKIAFAKKIEVALDIKERTLNKLKSLPFETTSSMHTDFINNKSRNELLSLTRYVIDEARKYNVPTPTYDKIFRVLEKKTARLSVNG